MRKKTTSRNSSISDFKGCKYGNRSFRLKYSLYEGWYRIQFLCIQLDEIEGLVGRRAKLCFLMYQFSQNREIDILKMVYRILEEKMTTFLPPSPSICCPRSVWEPVNLLHFLLLIDYYFQLYWSTIRLFQDSFTSMTMVASMDLCNGQRLSLIPHALVIPGRGF